MNATISSANELPKTQGDDMITGLSLFDAGLTDLVSVVPPGATLNPASRLLPDQLGKAPGIKRPDGTWTGYGWQGHVPDRAEVEAWQAQGANIGLRSTRFPGVDIDVLDPQLAMRIEGIARAVLGPAPVRVGKAPKRLLVYRAKEPFARMRLHLSGPDGVEHLIEVLGAGQQYLVAGTHPSGAIYAWSQDVVAADGLSGVALADVERFFAAVERAMASSPGWTTRRAGSGSARGEAGSQEALLAPSADAVRALVEQVPNAPPQFSHRDDYLRMGYAIKAACGADHEDEALTIWGEWVQRWAHPEKGGKPRRAYMNDWRRMSGPYVVGWPWLQDQARVAGVNTAAEVFGVLEDAPPERDGPPIPLFGTEHWLAWRAVRLIGHRLRFVPARQLWYVWDGTHWVPDSVKLAESHINTMLIAEAQRLVQEAPDDAAAIEAKKLARSFLTAAKASNVRHLLESDRNIALGAESLDSNPWIINTPGGIVDLKSGEVRACNPEDLCSKITATGLSTATPEKWLKFLHEACDGDPAMVDYLQRVAGYTLSGDTGEQSFWFIWGSGGNGKSIFLDTMQGILKDYAATATMDALTATNGDRHTTDLASMAGARFVTSSETAAGKRWDEQRIKALTGGGMISARFMRQDNFEFRPQFKLLVSGNHQPGLRDVGDAMKRRMRLVPFTTKPAVPNKRLFDELREEWPQILGWMVQGCLLWQRDGMQTPSAVLAETAEYFEEEDSIGQFLRERAVEDADAVAYTADLFSAWTEWANANNAYVGDSKRLASALHSRGYQRWRGEGGRRGFRGLKMNQRLGAVT